MLNEGLNEHQTAVVRLCRTLRRVVASRPSDAGTITRRQRRLADLVALRRTARQCRLEAAKAKLRAAVDTCGLVTGMWCDEAKLILDQLDRVEDDAFFLRCNVAMAVDYIALRGRGRNYKVAYHLVAERWGVRWTTVQRVVFEYGDEARGFIAACDGDIEDHVVMMADLYRQQGAFESHMRF